MEPHPPIINHAPLFPPGSTLDDVARTSSEPRNPILLVTWPPQQLRCSVRVEPQLFTELGVSEVSTAEQIRCAKVTVRVSQLLLNVSAANGNGTIDEVFKPADDVRLLFGR
jgi:hypothetical protein